MKKCIFYLFLAIISFIFCKKSYIYADSNPLLFEKLLFSIGANANFKTQNFQESKYDFSLQNFALIFKDFSLQASWKSESTEISKIPKMKNPVWLADLSFKERNIPVSFKIGTLSFSGSLKELKNPAVSSSAIQFSKISKTNASLNVKKASPSNPEPLGFGMQFAKAFPIAIQKVQINAAVNANDFFAASMLANFKFSKKSALCVSDTIARYSAQNTSSSYFSQTRFFANSNFFANNLQILLTVPKNKLKFSTSFFQSPYRILDFTTKFEHNFFLPLFSLNYAFFYASAKDIFTSSANQLKNLFQFKINPQIAFVNSEKTSLLTVGTIFLSEEKIQSDYSTQLLLKQGIYFQLKKESYIQKLSFSIENFSLSPSLKDLFLEQSVFPPLQSLEKSSYKLAYSKQTKNYLSAFLALKFSYTPSESELSAKFSNSIKLPGNASARLKTSFESTLKEKLLKKTVALVGFSAKSNTKFVKINYSANIKFYLE